jgi:hypothetical protein
MNKIIIFNLIIAVLSIIFNNCSSKKPEVCYLIKEKVIKNFPADSVPFFNRPQKIKIQDSKIFILDERNQRIVVFDYNFKYLNQIGRKGRAPGEFIFPASFQVFKDFVYVPDAANYRIDVMALDGKYIRSFRSQFPPLQGLAFCINSNGNLFFNHPMSDHLIKVYNEYGDVVDGFGELVNNTDPMFRISLNYAHIEVDEYDNIYFVMIPILRKYDKNKRLLWERDLTIYTEIQEMHDFIIKKREKNPEQKYNVFYLSKDIYYRSPYLFILFQGIIPYGNTVYVFDKNGVAQKILRISKGEIPIDSLHNYGKLAVDEKGQIYLSDKTEYQVVKFKIEN